MTAMHFKRHVIRDNITPTAPSPETEKIANGREVLRHQWSGVGRGGRSGHHLRRPIFDGRHAARGIADRIGRRAIWGGGRRRLLIWSRKTERDSGVEQRFDIDRRDVADNGGGIFVCFCRSSRRKREKMKRRTRCTATAVIFESLSPRRWYRLRSITTVHRCSSTLSCRHVATRRDGDSNVSANGNRRNFPTRVRRSCVRP